MEIKISIILCTTISLSGVYISKCRDFRRRRRLYRTVLYIVLAFFFTHRQCEPDCRKLREQIDPELNLAHKNKR